MFVISNPRRFRGEVRLKTVGIAPTINATDYKDPLRVEVREMALKGVFAINPYRKGVARTIKGQYYKTSQANFLVATQQGATGVIKTYELKGNCNRLNARACSSKSKWDMYMPD